MTILLSHSVVGISYLIEVQCSESVTISVFMVICPYWNCICDGGFVAWNPVYYKLNWDQLKQ